MEITKSTHELKALLERAGVRKTEAAALLQVRRPTIYGWLRRNPCAPHAVNRRNIDLVSQLLATAVASGALPLPPSTPRSARLRELRRLLMLKG